MVSRCLLSRKSPTTVSKETYYSVKRDLLRCLLSQRCRAIALERQPHHQHHLGQVGCNCQQVQALAPGRSMCLVQLTTTNYC